MKFRVKYNAIVSNQEISGIEAEAGWFLIDQQGKFYSYGPMRPIKPCGDKYQELIPLIKVHDEWLTIKEIEERIK